jgi:hypothetical protein
MKQSGIFLFFLFFIFLQKINAQEIIYSDFRNEEDMDTKFEILGKMNDSYVIYKNIRWKHVLAFYDNDMRISKSNRLKFIPDKTFNIDFITYPDHFYMIYQYQKNNIVYCMGVKMGADGTKLNEPVELDTTRVPFLADSKIYNTVYSQDKQKIMVYKMQYKNQLLTIATKLYDTGLKLLDSTRMVTKYDERKELYNDLSLDNEGNFIFTKEEKEGVRGNIVGLDIFYRKPGTKDYKTITIDLKDKFIDETKIKIDNLNRHYILNSFYYTQQRGEIKGLFTLLIDAASMDTIRSVFNILPDSIRSKVKSNTRYINAFDNLYIRETIVKKDGGFILTTEDYSTQNRSNPNALFNRSNYLYNNYPYNSINDYYSSYPAYGYYRPLSSFGNWQDVTYYYENILILSLDNKLNMEWNNIIPKAQSDDGNDNFLSFSTMNIGAEIHFLYNEVNRNRQLISNQSIYPNGQMKRYPTLKSREAGYEFMPRLAKQIGYREVIVPCVYRSKIAFAKVILTE